MSVQSIANEIENGTIPILGLADEFDFECQQCGSCCHNIDILINPWDVIKLHRELKITTDEFMSKYINILPGSASKWPIMLLNMVEPAIKLPGHTRSACVFLKSGKCSVYKERPTVCRSFPIGRVSKYEQETNASSEEQYILVQGECPASNVGVKHTIGDWIIEADLEDRWAKSRDYDKVLMSILSNKEIDMKEILDDGVAYQILIHLLFNIDDQEKSYISIINKKPTDDELYGFILMTTKVWVSGLWKEIRDAEQAGETDAQTEVVS